MDEAFAELEAQLAEISKINVHAKPSQTPAPSSANPNRQSPAPSSLSSPATVSTPVSSSGSNTQVLQLQQQVYRLERELEAARSSARDANARADATQQKLVTMVNAVKEERDIQQRNYEDLEQRYQASETRSEQLEEKLIKLVELVKKERSQSRAMDAPVNVSSSSNLHDAQALQAAKKKIVDLEENVQQLTMQVEALEKELYNQADLRSQESQLNEQLKEELADLNNQLAEAEVHGKKYAQELIQTKTLLEQERKKSASSASSADVQRLQERAQQAEALAADYEQKIAKLVAAVKSERGALREKMQAAEERAASYEQRIQELEHALSTGTAPPKHTPSISQDTTALENKLRQAEKRADFAEEKLRRAEERVQDLEFQLANRPTSSDSSPPPAPDFIPGGPPPPPPPPPTLKLIDSTKLNIKTKEGTVAVRKVDPREQNMANLIEEIRKGVKLKSVAASQGSPASSPKTVGRSEGVDLGALANDIVKIRQNRMQQKTQAAKGTPRKSTTLTALLKELDGL